MSERWLPVAPGNVNTQFVAGFDGIRGDADDRFEGRLLGRVFTPRLTVVIDSPSIPISCDRVGGDTHRQSCLLEIEGQRFPVCMIS